MQKCWKPIPDSDDEDDLLSIAINLVNSIICQCKKLLRKDLKEHFLYKKPNVLMVDYVFPEDYLEDDLSSDEAEPRRKSAFPEEAVNWVSIGANSHASMLHMIRDYVAVWDLPRVFKYVVIKIGAETVPELGTRHFVDATFSKPTKGCPNPLATATVHFSIHVSMILPKDYPVMVTYRFEGYKMNYYALGRQAFRSIRFQRFYLESILHSKLMFFAEIFECRRKDIKECEEEEEEIDNEGNKAPSGCPKLAKYECNLNWLTK